jgi:hypothetical protein
MALWHADYVGTVGNCGEDGRLGRPPTKKWHCENIEYFNYLPEGVTPSFSMAVDPDGYPVVAYDYAASNNVPPYLYVAYPKARAGIPGSGWISQEIDGVPNLTINTGGQ